MAHSKVRPVMKVGQNFMLFGVMHQVTEVIPYSEWNWAVTAEVLDSGEETIIYIPTDYRTTDGIWVGDI